MIQKYLYPKEIFVSKEPAEVTTVLGSCISVCLYDAGKKIGGINHYMLARGGDATIKDGQYGEYAIPKLIHQMEYIGASVSSLKAKIFGGYSVNMGQKDHFGIGRNNIAIAKEILRKFEIPVIGSSIGGDIPRKIVFFTHTGEVALKLINGLKI